MVREDKGKPEGDDATQSGPERGPLDGHRGIY
jgi:hypothetical protein